MYGPRTVILQHLLGVWRCTRFRPASFPRAASVRGDEWVVSVCGHMAVTAWTGGIRCKLIIKFTCPRTLFIQFTMFQINIAKHDIVCRSCDSLTEAHDLGSARATVKRAIKLKGSSISGAEPQRKHRQSVSHTRIAAMQELCVRKLIRANTCMCCSRRSLGERGREGGK